MNNIEQYRKRFNRLIESSMGDVRPLISEQTTNELIGKTVNLYYDLEMQKVSGTVKIESIKKNDSGATLICAEVGAEVIKRTYYYECKIPNQIKSSAVTFHNKQLTDSLNNQFCQTGQGGTNVPKADMASNNSASSGQEPQSV